MMRFWLGLLGLLLVVALPGCGSDTQPTREIDFLPLNSIEITSANLDSTSGDPQAAAGTTNRFKATGHYGDPATFQFTRDITDQVTWTSTDTAVLTVSNATDLTGLGTAVAAGQTTVTAELDGVQGSLPFTVSNATISTLTITPPATTTLYAGKTLQLEVSGTFSDGNSQDLTEAATWSSGDTTVATVKDTLPGKGLVTAVAVGTVDITAAFDTLSATQSLVVAAATLDSIEIKLKTNEVATLAVGTTTLLTATGTYSDGSTKDMTSSATWSSATTGVATVDQNAGTSVLVTAVTAGTSKITATVDGVTSPNFTVTVSSATLSSLSIDQSAPTVAVGGQLNLTVTGDFSDGSSQNLTRDVTWSSADTAIATVSNATGYEGEVTGIAAGTETITATASSAIPKTSGTTVSPATVDLTVQ